MARPNLNGRRLRNCKATWLTIPSTPPQGYCAEKTHGTPADLRRYSWEQGDAVVAHPEIDFEGQDQAEIYDETHLDDEGEGDISLDEADDVLDVTQAYGDADDTPFDEEDQDLDEALGLDGVEAEADALLGVDSVRISEIDADGEVGAGPDEVELVYAGLMRNQRGAQASAAHWEAKRLSDDDIEDLGYGPDTEERA